jgi:hypothetical protein
MAIMNLARDRASTNPPKVVENAVSAGVAVCVVDKNGPTDIVCDGYDARELQTIARENPGCGWGIPLGEQYKQVAVESSFMSAVNALRNLAEFGDPANYDEVFWDQFTTPELTDDQRYFAIFCWLDKFEERFNNRLKEMFREGLASRPVARTKGTISIDVDDKLISLDPDGGPRNVPSPFHLMQRGGFAPVKSASNYRNSPDTSLRVMACNAQSISRRLPTAWFAPCFRCRWISQEYPFERVILR